MKKLHSFLALGLFSFLFSAPTFAQNINGDSELVFGGSFSPPTIEHMNLVAQLMTRFQFTKGRMVVAYPYKKGAAPAEVSLGLTQMAVQHFDEILELGSLPHQNFQKVGDNAATWIGQQGKTHTLKVDDRDIRTQNKENTLSTLTQISQELGGGKNVYWLSGGDSFSSVPSWTPQWKELFNQAHWIVVARPSEANDPKAVKFENHNPLEKTMPADFMSQYEYSFDAAKQVHIYQNKDESKPNIYIVNTVALDDSSSNNRASLAQPGDHEKAQDGLQPTIFKECVDKGYYAKEEENAATNITVYTKNNLQRYLQWLFHKVERTRKRFLTAEEIKDFQELSQVLVTLAAEAADEQRNKPIAVGVLSHIYEHLIEHISEMKELKNLSKIIREKAREYKVKTFATVFVSLEFVETFVAPPLLIWLFGAKGTFMIPFFHPNEYITIPAFLAYNLVRKIHEKIQIAGSLSLFKKIADYRNRLLRGDPDSTLFRAKLQTALSLSSEQFTVNVIKSRLPKWIPLPLRKLDNNRIKWHDLNISLNELRAVIQDPFLVRELEEVAGSDEKFLGQLLLTAALKDPKRRLVFDLFITSRYIRPLFFQEVATEIMAAFSRAEIMKVEKFKNLFDDVARDLSPSEKKETSYILAMVYAVVKILNQQPDLESKDSFWDAVINLVVTEYPGRERDPRSSKQLIRLRYFTRTLEGARGEQLASRLHGFLNRTTETSAEVDSKLTEYFYLGRKLTGVFFYDALRKPQGGSESSSVLHEVLPTIDLESSSNINFVWEVHSYASSVKSRKILLDAGFDRAMIYFEGRPRAKNAHNIFLHASDYLDDRIEEALKELWLLEFKIAEYKYPRRFNNSSLENDGYLRDRYSRIQKTLELRLEQLTLINQMMMGTVPVDLSNYESLRTTVATSLGIPATKNYLGRNPVVRACARVLKRDQ